MCPLLLTQRAPHLWLVDTWPLSFFASMRLPHSQVTVGILYAQQNSSPTRTVPAFNRRCPLQDFLVHRAIQVLPSVLFSSWVVVLLFMS